MFNIRAIKMVMQHYLLLNWNKLRYQQLKKTPSLIEINIRNKIDEINKNRFKTRWSYEFQSSFNKTKFLIDKYVFIETTFKTCCSCIKLVWKQIENYNFKTQYYSGINTFSIRLIHENFINVRVWILHSRCKYSTSHTEIIDGRDHQFLVQGYFSMEFFGTTSYGVTWANIRKIYRLLFDKTSLKSINYMTSLILFLMGWGFVNWTEFLWVPTQSF